MVGFSMTAKKTNVGGEAQSSGNVDQDAWNAWNEYLFDLVKCKEVDRGNGRFRKTKTCIGVVNMIMDFGTPPAADNLWKVKPEHVMPSAGEEYSQYELDYMEQHKGSDFVTVQDWDANAPNAQGKKGKMVDVRKQSSKRNPVQEFGLCIDIPSILVDYSKHPQAEEGLPPDLRPYRISLNGYMFGNRKKIGRPLQFETDFRTDEVSDKNFIRKIAIASGIDDALVVSGFDIGELASAVCNYQVVFDISRGDRVFLNDSASKPSSVDDFTAPDDTVYTATSMISKALETKGLQPFTGILLNGMEYTDDMLKMLKGDKFNFVARAMESDNFIVTRKSDGKEFEMGVSYEASDFKVAYDKYCDEEGNATSSTKTPPPVVKKEVPKPKVVSPVENEFVDDFSDDIPF